MIYTTLPSLQGSTPQNSSRKRKVAPEFPPPRKPQSLDKRRSRSRSPPNRPLPAIPVGVQQSRSRQQGQPSRPSQTDQPAKSNRPGQLQSPGNNSPPRPQRQQQRAPGNTSPPQQRQSQHPLRSKPPSKPLPIPHQSQGRNPLIMRKPVPTPTPSPPSSSTIQGRPYYHGKVLPPIPQFDAITMSPSPAKGGAMKSARSESLRSGEEVSMEMDGLSSGDDVDQVERVKEIAREEFGGVQEASQTPDITHSFDNIRSRVHALMIEHPGTEGSSKLSFDARKERNLGTQVRLRPVPVSESTETESLEDEYRASKFQEELIVDEEDVADFYRWKEMKLLDEQRYATTQATDSNDPRSPLEHSSSSMRNITDSVPKRFLRKIASFGVRRDSQGEGEGDEPGLWKRQSSSSLLKKVTSLSCMSIPDCDSGEAPVFQRRQARSNLASTPTTSVRTTMDVPPPVRPQRPARSPLDLHVGRMEFEDSNPFAYVECQRPMDAFPGLKRWSWYNKPGCRSSNVDPDWDNAKKELDRVGVADDHILSIIADYEDIPE